MIERAELVKRFLRADDARIVVVSAPAGFGKSTSVALWDEIDERPFAWVHVDAADNDPLHLLRHVALAVNEIEPVGTEVVRRLAGHGRSVDTDAMPSLGRWLERRDPFVLVIDDVHLLTATASLACLA